MTVGGDAVTLGNRTTYAFAATKPMRSYVNRNENPFRSAKSPGEGIAINTRENSLGEAVDGCALIFCQGDRTAEQLAAPRRDRSTRVCSGAGTQASADFRSMVSQGARSCHTRRGNRHGRDRRIRPPTCTSSRQVRIAVGDRWECSGRNRW